MCLKNKKGHLEKKGGKTRCPLQGIDVYSLDLRLRTKILKKGGSSKLRKQ